LAHDGFGWVAPTGVKSLPSPLKSKVCVGPKVVPESLSWSTFEVKTIRPPDLSIVGSWFLPPVVLVTTRLVATVRNAASIKLALRTAIEMARRASLARGTREVMTAPVLGLRMTPGSGAKHSEPTISAARRAEVKAKTRPETSRTTARQKAWRVPNSTWKLV
jgi:hypothetical protein